MSYIIVTGANDSYILTLINFIKYHLNIGVKVENIIIYDLGLSNTNLEKLRNPTNQNLNIKIFDYNKYPEHVDLNKFNVLHCSYAFKPIIIYNEACLNSNVPLIWLDCACNLTINILYKIIDAINRDGFYCPVGNYEKTIETIELNHPQTLSMLGISQKEHFNELYNSYRC